MALDGTQVPLLNGDNAGVQVDHPYSALLKYAKCLKGDKPKLQKMVQVAEAPRSSSS